METGTTGVPCLCRHSSGSIAKLTRRLTSMSEGHSMEIDAAQQPAPAPVPQSDALIDGFTVPEVSPGRCEMWQQTSKDSQN